MHRKTRKFFRLATLGLALAVAWVPAQAASHSDAPLIKQDPQGP